MYCPKCQENFEEGSRRFCPTDGARLISEPGAAGRGAGGIFANLIPRMEGLGELDPSRPEPPAFTMTERDSPAKEQDDDEIFFELDDISPVQVFEPESAEPVEARQAARKIKPFEIPAGHVDLGAAKRQSAFATDFDLDDPEGFVGRTVKGRYRVTEFLGGDESGLAYLAHDRILENRPVLLRVLTGEGSDAIMDSILTEERVSLSHFSHPNIARLIDSGEFVGGTNFIISEYVDALSVRDLLSIHGRFDAERAARIIRQAASALNEAHGQGIVHRDIRPQNLIVDATARDGEQVKLVNFGASTGDPTPQNYRYKAHEVLEGRIATVSSDIFSLAVVAYEMLTGRVPFEGDSEKDLVREQNAGIRVPPTAVRTEMSRAVDAVLAKAMAFNPSDRYPKARDFGDAFYGAVAEPMPAAMAATVPPAAPKPAAVRTETLKPLVPAPATAPVKEIPVQPTPDEPAWKNRSPEPPQVESSRPWIAPVIGVLLLALVGIGWYALVNRPGQPPAPANQANTPAGNAAANTEMPPLARNIPQPPNTNFYANTKQNLRGDLLRNFVGFTMYYPKDWKVNGPQVSSGDGIRGKFIDISRERPDGRLQEQMLVSYYPSKGTYKADADRFPELVKEANETLKKLLPGYQMVSEGEIKINGEWRGYELKFQAGGETATGEKLIVWGRRLFIPAARPGVRNGFEITMLATSLAPEIRSVDDVGVKGELGPILYSFEPSQNF